MNPLTFIKNFTPRPFFRGLFDQDPKSHTPPRFELLVDSPELSRGRPVPAKLPLLRSLCKGKGTLRKNRRGLFFLDLDNRFISSFLPYLKAQGLIHPPYFNLLGSPEGAHISIVSEREAHFHYLYHLNGLEQEFPFELEGLYSLQNPAMWPEIEEIWFFQVRSPALEQLRRAHFLPPLPNGHLFSLPVAIRARKSAPLPLTFRLNAAALHPV